MQAVGIQFSCALSALHRVPQQSLQQVLCGDENTLSLQKDLLDRPVWVGAYPLPLVEHLPAELHMLDSRNLRFALTALQQIEQPLLQLTAGMAKQRLAIVMGTSTSGIADNQALLQQQKKMGQNIQLLQAKQAMSSLAFALQQYLGWQGFAYSISTACSSSGKAIATAQRLLNSDLADVVLVGGVDTLCPLTLNGFNSLESLSSGICRPSGVDRDGINIGEAAAMFVMTRESAPVMLLGSGESMDAWHISAPHPEGVGAEMAMRRALEMAQLSADQIDYLNLHGTATMQNDAMESKAVAQIFQHPVWVSSSKHKTGHCLGAAGAIEAYICQQILQDQQAWLPWHQQHAIDPQLAALNYVQPHSQLDQINHAMSNSFAFGGSNVSLIFARGTA
ncbi:beta-ketoacyl-[acyl-carrier-protein] synthase family protein [Acinetobacter puyangensis]|uniref:3-oxoacyl-[acyl-carrier-protein] synthase-1 n=1 Tax=Acinetobacter puyangensis TaxID=1096779 RepID=A0A240E3A3_9GAMM|nr:beta-ketoacyl-ACP synthase [Acinetobacter puyangensis]SNX43248.1 3-oxoacyl-[acyl-carrier-protein] synthase-1 [Acinetobacter puyangensis]